MKITMSWSSLTAASHKYVHDVLTSGWLSRHKYIPRFEQEVAKIHGAKHGILVSSGTDALRISLATLKEVFRWKDGSEVIVPALTFVATVNAVLQAQLTPVFADVDDTTGNLRWGGWLAGNSIVAVLPVHLFGLPVEIPKTPLKIVEDSCETFGVHKISGDLMAFSFYMSHHVATGVGGMILTNSDKYAKIARSLMNHGRIDDGSHFKFGRVGYSSRSTEMEAALGCAALEHYGTDLLKRRTLAGQYQRQLVDVKEIQSTPYDIRHSWMFYPIRLLTGNREKLMAYLRTAGIENREAMPLVDQPVFKNLYTKGSCPNAELWTKNGLLLPLHPKMSVEDVAVVCRAVKGFF